MNEMRNGMIMDLPLLHKPPYSPSYGAPTTRLKFSIKTSVFLTCDEYSSDPTIGQNGGLLNPLIDILVLKAFLLTHSPL